MPNTHFLNGKLVSEAELLISPRDLGYSRGYGVFDFLVTYSKQKPFLLHRHLDRLFDSAETIELSIPWSKKQISEWVIETLKANDDKDEKVIRIVISGGNSFNLVPPSIPTIIIIIDSFIPFPPKYYEQGVPVLLSEFSRYRPEAKTNNYIDGVMQMQRVKHTDIDEIIYYSDGMVREGTRTNVFALIEGELLTPKNNILGGITRNLLCEILHLDVPVKIQDFSVDSFKKATEIFITATGKGVVPVCSLDSNIVGVGKVGSITKDVIRQYKEYINSNEWNSF